MAVMERGDAIVVPNAEAARTTPFIVAFTKTGNGRLVSLPSAIQGQEQGSSMVWTMFTGNAETDVGGPITQAVINVPADLTDLGGKPRKMLERLRVSQVSAFSTNGLP
jgi:molecular chaperone DnaK (HSP70)